MEEITVSRRNFVAASVAAICGLAFFGCSPNGGKRTAEADRSEAGSAASDSPVSVSGAADLHAVESEGPKGASGENDAGKVLVACFSATGNTRGVAKVLAAYLGADYFEIEAADPYTAEDLDYGDKTTRATAEQNDAATRPALAAVPDFSTYDVVLLGHPIWWGKAPRIMCTLLESVDVAGKRFAEFCTSGSSGIEGATSELRGISLDAEWIGANRFAAGASDDEIAAWVDSLGIR